MILRKKRFRTLISILLALICSPLDVTAYCDDSSSTDRIDEYLNHANSYYWLSRSRYNSIREAEIALKYLDSASNYLSSNKLDFDDKEKSLQSIAARIAELTLMIEITKDNLNGYFPVYTQYSGKINQYNYYDDPIEVAIEAALSDLLNNVVFKTSRELNQLLTYTAVEVLPNDDTLLEVVRQYLNNNSKLYVISESEFNEAVNGNTVDNVDVLSKLGKYYNSQIMGKITVTVYDQLKEVNYVGVSFELHDLHAKQLISSTYTEAIISDKTGLTPPYKNDWLFLYFLSYALFIGFYWFFERKNTIDAQHVFRWFSVGIMGLLIGIITSKGLQPLLQIIPVSPDAFMGDPESWVWVLLFPFSHAVIPVVLLILSTMLVKRFYVDHRQAVIGVLYFAYLTVFYYLGKEYNKYFEQPPGIDIVLFTLLACVLTSLSTGFWLHNFYRDKRSYYSLLEILYVMLPAGIVFYVSLSVTPNYSIPVPWIIGLILSAALPVVIDRTRLLRFTTTGRSNTGRSAYGLLDRLREHVKEQLMDTGSKFYVPSDQKYIDALNSIVTNNTRFIHLHIEGPSGIGKTTLLTTWATRIKEEGTVQIFYGDCDAVDGSGIPYEPFYEAFHHMVGKGLFFSGNQVASELLKQASPILDTTPIGGLVGAIVNSNQDFKGSKVSEINDKLVRLISGFRNKKQSPQKVIVILEDCQYIDEKSFDLLQLFWNTLLIQSQSNHRFPDIVFITTSSLDSERSKSTALSLITGSADDKNSFSGIIRQYDHAQLLMWNAESREFPSIVELPNTDFVTLWLSECLGESSFNEEALRDLKRFFSSQETFSPRYYFEILKFLTDHGKMQEAAGSIGISEDIHWEVIPLEESEEELYQDKFKSLDDNLLKVLESAAFIGPRFEADVLSKLWQIERLELIHLLIKAENEGIIIDLSDYDDMYEFTSKKVRNALKRFTLKSGNRTQLPQIVKEYHKSIIHIQLGVSTISYDSLGLLQTINYDKLLVAAERSIQVAKEMPAESTILLLVAGYRCYQSGDVKSSKRLFAAANLDIPGLWENMPSEVIGLLRVVRRTIGKEDVGYLNHVLAFAKRTVAGGNGLQNGSWYDLIDAYFELIFASCEFEGTEWPDAELTLLLSDEDVPFQQIFRLSQIRRRMQGKLNVSEQEQLQVLYRWFNQNEKLKETRLYGKLLNLLFLASTAGGEDKEQYLQERLQQTFQASLLFSDTKGMQEWIEDVDWMGLSFEKKEDLAFILSSLDDYYSKQAPNPLELRRSLTTIRKSLNLFLADDFGCYLSDLTKIEIDIDMGVPYDRVEGLLTEAFYTYRSLEQRIFVGIFWLDYFLISAGDDTAKQPLEAAFHLLSTEIKYMDQTQLQYRLARVFLPPQVQLLELQTKAANLPFAVSLIESLIAYKH